MAEAFVQSGAPHTHVSGIELRNASIGITRFDIPNAQLEWDSRAATIFQAGSDDRPALDIWHERVHPDDLHLLRDLYGDACASIGAECIYRVILPDGSVRHILTRSVSIERASDGSPAVLTGVVSQIDPEPDSGHRLTDVLDNVSLGFAIIDRAMIVRYINAQTERHLGVLRTDIVGHHLHEALPTTKGSYFDDLHREAMSTGREVTVEVPALFLPGTILQVTANYVDGVVAVSFRDVTDAATTTTRLLGAYRELLIKSRLDDLTGVLNRSALFERIERISGETRPPAALLFVDVDDFKAINDTYGHLTGDHVLRTTAHRLAALCDASIVFGRIGGDEFVAAVFDDTLLSSSTAPQDLAARMHAAARQPMRWAEAEISVNISIGVAHNTDESSLEDLLAAADTALYEAKAGVPRIDSRIRRR